MTSHPHTCALSFVIPLYNSALTISNLVNTIELLAVEGGHEVVLVNDGSADNTRDVCLGLIRSAKIPIIYIEHARNFGEHNAVLTGWRHARGAYMVNLDDDGQNPPEEAVRLWHHARQHSLDVVYGHYGVKQHSWFRNMGSSFTNWVTDWALDKPQGFYLSSFRCVSAFITKRVVDYAGPYPYIDGLLLQVTQRLGSITVRHDARHAGQSGYTFRRLVRLWLSAWLNFSLAPLRAASIVGLILAVAGVFAFFGVLWLWYHNRGPEYGWGWVTAGMLIFSGTQLVILGVMGEYLGRMFLTVNQRPQSVVREVVKS